MNENVQSTVNYGAGMHLRFVVKDVHFLAPNVRMKVNKPLT
jgi:hypothetical protein